jgi:streptogramin lyase
MAYNGGIMRDKIVNNYKFDTIDTCQLTIRCGMTLPRGTLADLALSFARDDDTGIFSPGDGQIYIVSNGQAVLQITDTGITSTVPIVAPGLAVTLTSAGGTESLVSDGVGPALANKGLTAGAGVSLASDATSVTIAATGGNITLSNAGTGESVVNDGVGPTLATKSVTGGLGVVLTSTATDVNVSMNMVTSIFYNVFPEQTVSLGDAVVGTDQYASGVLGPDGKVYFIPHDATQFAVYNPDTQMLDFFGTVSADTSKWQGGVVIMVGAVPYMYCVPKNSTTMAKVNLNTRAVTTFGVFPGAAAYAGAVLDPKGGGFYLIPHNASQPARVDVSTDTVTSFGVVDPAIQKYKSAALAPNGKIYCCPEDATDILVIDPVTDTTATIAGIPAGSEKWKGAAFSPVTRKIYCAPRNATSVLEIDPATDTFATFGVLGAGDKYNGIVAAGDGKLYCFPADATDILAIDPTGPSVSTFGVVAGGSPKTTAGVLMKNGQILAIPRSVGNVLLIKPGNQTQPTETLLSAFFNKY